MIPDTVVRHVEHHLATLKVLARARQTDAQFNGGGRYEWEVYLNRQADLERAWEALNEFERLCGENGEDPYALYTQHGRPERLSAAATRWLAPDARLSADALGGEAERLAWVESGASSPDLRVIHCAGGYGAILRSERAQLELQDCLDAIFQQRLVNMYRALRELGWTGESFGPVLHRELSERTWKWAHTEKKVGAGRNVVSLEYTVFEASAPRGEKLLRVSDLMTTSAKVMAGVVEDTLQTHLRAMPSSSHVADTVVRPAQDIAPPVDEGDVPSGFQP